MGLFANIRQFFKPKAEFKTGYQSELDSFFHRYNTQRKDWLDNPLRVKELNKHQAIFDKRDYSVDKPSEKLWKDF